jgi:septal ring factor EnvC (AmiA/AmiB activator)
MELSWTNILIASIPVLGAVIGAFIKDYVNNKIQDVRITNLEDKVEHINSNWKQRDVALMRELKELKEEIKHLSIQIAEIGSKNG